MILITPKLNFYFPPFFPHIRHWVYFRLKPSVMFVIYFIFKIMVSFKGFISFVHSISKLYRDFKKMQI
jgi:hypothetical protein